MAAAFCVGAPALGPRSGHISGFLSPPSLSSSPASPSILRRRSPCPVLCARSYNFEPTTSSCAEEDSGTTKRRQALFQILFSALYLPSISAVASAEADLENFRTYEDTRNKFQLLVPQDWQVGTGDTDNFKLVTAFYPNEASNSNVSVVITAVGPDYTGMGSFGTAEAFAQRLVNGLDRSWQRPPGVAAKLVNSKSANGLYYVEYTLQNPGESRRHIVSVIGMAFNGWYNRLYTVTGQFVEDSLEEKYKSQIEKAVSSFRFI